MLVSILDDINDVHGTIEELEQFTKMIERWDTSMEDLPDYTKVWFEALFVSSSEIEEETTKEGRSYCVSYTKEAINLILLLTQSARCFNEDHVPTLEENRKNGVFSCTYPLLTVSSLCGMGKIASKEVFDWLFTHPKILASTSDLFRLIDDVASHEFEQERGHVASSVECCLKQHGVSKQDAHDELTKLVESDWKDINEKPLGVPEKDVLQVFLNFGRAADVFYSDYDAFTESRTMIKRFD
ncbi:hypothetical protein POTOM_039974 [Populus tomentosa]|uniref:Terpene synthase metal-binding domain-containing protein n=1 Tax=Populus tomentosa TaxID=118781 RepID=A0A8X8CJH4_POPTO|nr:hypothetical protein POTOM_039974 [Populus tomentosa]